MPAAPVCEVAQQGAAGRLVGAHAVDFGGVVHKEGAACMGQCVRHLGAPAGSSLLGAASTNCRARSLPHMMWSENPGVCALCPAASCPLSSAPPRRCHRSRGQPGPRQPPILHGHMAGHVLGARKPPLAAIRAPADGKAPPNCGRHPVDAVRLRGRPPLQLLAPAGSAAGMRGLTPPRSLPPRKVGENAVNRACKSPLFP